MPNKTRYKTILSPLSPGTVVAGIVISVFAGISHGESSLDPRCVQRWDFSAPGDALGWTVAWFVCG